jgi:uncharacterized protein (TIGR00251 family)
VSSFMHESDQGVILRVQVQARASRDEVVGVHGNALKVRITAAPVEGAANRHLLKFLAGQLGIRSGQMTIQSGRTSKVKHIVVRELSAAEVEHRLICC